MKKTLSILVLLIGFMCYAQDPCVTKPSKFDRIRLMCLDNSTVATDSLIAIGADGNLMPFKKSRVVDVLEFTNFAGFPVTGVKAKIYVDKATNLMYRWNGSSYVNLTTTTYNLQQTTDNGNTTSNEVISQTIVSGPDGNFYSKLKPDGSIEVYSPDTTILTRIDPSNVTRSGVNYPWPNGATSRIATLLDIPNAQGLKETLDVNHEAGTFDNANYVNIDYENGIYEFYTALAEHASRLYANIDYSEVYHQGDDGDARFKAENGEVEIRQTSITRSSQTSVIIDDSTAGAGVSNIVIKTPGTAGSYQVAFTDDIAGYITNTITNGDTTHAPDGNSVYDALILKADLISPTLTGTPNAPTQSLNDNTTKIATTAYVDRKVENNLTASTTEAPSKTAVNTALALKQNSITPQPLTKTDDTNITLTLGGTPTTGLLQPISLTLGWTGTLADARITSSTNWNTAYSNRIGTFSATGSSGPASFSGNVLNIPNYTLAGLGGISGSGTSGFMALWSSTSAITTGTLYDDGSQLAIGTTSPSAKFTIRTDGTSSTTATNTGTFFENTTVATIGSNSVVKYVSPANVYSANAWKLNTPAASQNAMFKTQWEAINGPSQVEGRYNFMKNMNGAGWSNTGVDIYIDRFNYSILNAQGITAVGGINCFSLGINKTNGANGNDMAIFTGAYAITSGTNYGLNMTPSITPTSGTNIFNGFAFQPTINQTGGASGRVRGYYFNPTVTAAADLVALETTSGKVIFANTVTAGGTTGAQTINKTSGTVNFAAAATSLVVTNNLVTANSIVFVEIRTNDTTALIKNVVPTSGSFTINMQAAPTAETSVGFFVINN